MNHEKEIVCLTQSVLNIKRIGQIEGDYKLVDETNQILQCLLSATWELENPQPDSDEFISSIVKESRPRIEKLLVRVGAWTEDPPDTVPSPMKFD